MRDIASPAKQRALEWVPTSPGCHGRAVTTADGKAQTPESNPAWRRILAARNRQDAVPARRIRRQPRISEALYSLAGAGCLVDVLAGEIDEVLAHRGSG